MAYIYGEDFQQWATAGAAYLRGTGNYNTLLVQDITAQQAVMLSLGLVPAGAVLGSVGGNARNATLFYDTTRQALCVCHGLATTYMPSTGASGLRKRFSYSGDTLYVGACVEFGGSASLPGDFLFFGSLTSDPVFTTADGIGNMLYAVGVDVDGFLTLNGVSTTERAQYQPARVRLYLDVVFTPQYIELWFNNRRIAQQPWQAVPITDVAISVEKMVTADWQDLNIFVHSLALADNSDGFSQRMGRRIVNTEPITAAPTIGSTVQGQAGATALQVITKFATGPLVETDSTMMGSLVSPKGYVLNEFTTTRANSKVPYAALVNIQAKRLTPAGDGLGVHPYVTLNGQRYFGNVYVPRNSWRMESVEIPIPADQTFSTVTFGYEHDYKNLNKIWVDARDNVEVYGDAPSATMPTTYTTTSALNLNTQSLQTATYDAYTFNYAQSSLTTAKTDVTNVTYQQDQP